ncbi:hypothetical protein Alg130_09769 [Pyrenophora tritici-repentis]|nr:hypothetical protein Alg215_09860 [Pyrenophora tritici-repentis]KAI0574276.1 hypothetical protein Alg130_09769 [Pyrenophora tritici-repentis]KAI1527678.1 hypothetical protein PtrSN001A_009334 [Pyrenophora tritici-repentis]KAI1528822.1 hypothetical protein PtrSN001C_009318 [Pyrenophora tritici-repentis]KAI1563926.1 hypothetical protein PtrEW4_009138 [Pyrenophora tritici-repentis]
MFYIFRALGRLLGASKAIPSAATTTQVAETQPETSAPALSTETSATSSLTTSTPPADSSSATSSPDYRAAFNYASRPTSYARSIEPPVQWPSFGRPVDAPKSTADIAEKSTRHLGDISPPYVPLCDLAHINTACDGASAYEPADVDMTDAPTLPTPPASPTNQYYASEPTNESAEVNNNNTAPQNTTQNPQHTTTTTARPTIPRHPLSTTPNWVDEITYETSTPSYPLPETYAGTFRGIRYYAADYTSLLPCGSENHHHLLCGHYVFSALPCGRNCKTPVQDTAPFTCPTCRAAIDDVFNGKGEAAKVKEMQGVDASVGIAYAVELATRTLPRVKGGVADAVMAFLHKGYGREDCVGSEGPRKVETLDLREMVGEMQGGWERRQMRMMEEDALKAADEAVGRANASGREKRKGRADDVLADGEVREGKKMKTKLTSCLEPITDVTRGKKRSFSSSSSTSTSPSQSTHNNRNKKPKHKKQRTQPTPSGEVRFHEQLARLGPIVRGRKMNDGFENDVDVDGEGGEGRRGRKMARLQGGKVGRI